MISASSLAALSSVLPQAYPALSLATALSSSPEQLISSPVFTEGTEATEAGHLPKPPGLSSFLVRKESPSHPRLVSLPVLRSLIHPVTAAVSLALILFSSPFPGCSCCFSSPGHVTCHPAFPTPSPTRGPPSLWTWLLSTWMLLILSMASRMPIL